MHTLYCSRCLTTFAENAGRCPNLGCGAPRPATGWGEILGPGATLDRHYRVSRVLALAGGGVTYAGRALDANGEETGHELALKVLYAHRDAGDHLTRLANEAHALRALAHPHIVECHGFVHRQGAPPYLVTRFEHGGTLAEHLTRVGPLRPDVAAGCALQILRALQQAHARNVVHRDLKPQNILLEKVCERDEVPHLRVADFGIAKVLGPGDGITRLGMFIGTPEYAPPEQIMGHPATAAMDIFALGACFFTMLTGRPAFVPRDRHDVVSCLADLLALLPPRLPDPRSAAWRCAQSVIDAVMVPAAEDRAGAEDLVRLLEAVARASVEDAADGGAALSEGFTLTPASTVLPSPAEDGFTWVDAVTRFPTRTVPPVAVDGVASQSRVSSPLVQEAPSALAAPRTSVTAQVVAERSLPRDDVDPFEALGAPARSVEDAELSLDALVAGFGGVRTETRTPVHVPARAPSAPATSEHRDVPGDAPRAHLAAPVLAASVPAAPYVPEGDPAPDVLPEDAASLLGVLGRIDGRDRANLQRIAAKLNADPRGISALASGHRPGNDAALGVGLCRFAALAQRSDWTSRIRALLADADARVRAAACEALGAVGTVQGLSAVPALRSDPEPRVRVACAAALVSLAHRHRRADLARGTLEGLARDVHPDVSRAAAAALVQLEEG